MPEVEASFLTPGGRPAFFWIREDTSDWNSVNACTAVGDEYHLPHDLTGWAMDVGAHIGSVAVAFLLDNPEAHMVAVEAIPENVLLLAKNLKRNGVAGRCVVIAKAAAGGTGGVEIGYGGDDHHHFIGGGGSQVQRITVAGTTLRAILDGLGIDRIAWMKIDCEGCEYPFLASPYIGRVDHIEGEVHNGSEQLRMILDRTHVVSFGGDNPDFGPFVADVR
jgi:FkbM family methyltransferase